LDPSATEEIKRLSKVTDLSQPNIFRNALSVFRLIVNAYEDGAKVYTKKPGENPQEIKKPY